MGWPESRYGADRAGTSVGEAVAVIAVTYQLTRRQAFDLLYGISRTAHRSIRSVAVDVCATGTLAAALTRRVRPGPRVSVHPWPPANPRIADPLGRP